MSIEDILYLPGFKNPDHPPMPLHDRAAQFAPFKALTGYEEIINETAKNAGDSFEAKESEEEYFE